MTEIKIALYGDSLALPRQHIVSSQNRYFAQVESQLRRQNPGAFLEIKDRAQGGATITDLLGRFEHDNSYYDFPGHLVVLHCGIVDCAPRPLHDPIRTLIGHLPGPLRQALIRQIHRHRAFLIRTTGPKPKTRPARFRRNLDRFLKRASQLYRQVCLINICPTNSRIEKKSPGFNRMVDQYNQIINEVAAGRAEVIDIHSFLSSQGEHLDEFLVAEDGHHITEKTHSWLAQQILSRHSQPAGRVAPA